MVKRILGVIIFVVGLVGVGVAFLIYREAPRFLNSVSDSIDSSLGSVSQNLDIAQETLLLTRDTLVDVNSTLTTVETSMDQLGQAVNNTAPLLDQVSTVASEEVPESIEAVQTALPDLVQVAGIIDDTLTTLNRFAINESILGFDINYSLGVDYAPERPFDETVASLGDGLEGLPSSLRTLEIYTNVSKSNLQEVSQNLFQLGDDIGTLNARITEIQPLIDEYLAVIGETNDNTRLLRSQMAEQWDQLEQFIQIAAIWLALSQLAPLYLGWELMAGKRE